MRPVAYKFLLFSGLLFATGCANQLAGTGNAPPAGFLTGEGEAAYHSFIAELALQRGDETTAAREYAAAARSSDDPQLAERAATVAFRAGSYQFAEEAARLWLARTQDNADAHRMLLSLMVRNGRPESALPHLEYLLENGPEDREDAWLLLMFLLQREPSAADALTAMQALVANYSDEAIAHYALAALALEKKATEVAVVAALTARTLAPDWPRAGLMLARAQIEAGETAEGVATARSVAEGNNDDQVQLEFAGLLADNGELDEARLTLSRLLEKQPDMPDALFAAGLLEMSAERPEAARVHFTNLLGTGQRRPDALFFLGNVAEKLGETTNALQLYLRIRSGRHFPSAQIQIGKLLFELGQKEAALDHLHTFARRFPSYAESAVLLEGSLLVDTRRELEALELYSTTLSENPDARTVRYARALLLEQMDRVDAALADLFELVETDPEDGSALNALGYVLADRTERLDEALAYIEKAHERLPNEGAVLDSLGWVHFKLGNYDLALKYLELAFARIDDPEVAAHLGELLWVTGDTERATTIWLDAREKNDSNRSLNDAIQRFLGGPVND
ncbi:MAG: tetratricopeptide repeat protein [Gammaproteobacteria bacterium]|nr:tetratricopeptide repeat protein [Gammaproteobacteria bacterium]